MSAATIPHDALHMAANHGAFFGQAGSQDSILAKAAQILLSSNMDAKTAFLTAKVSHEAQKLPVAEAKQVHEQVMSSVKQPSTEITGRS